MKKFNPAKTLGLIFLTSIVGSLFLAGASAQTTTFNDVAVNGDLTVLGETAFDNYVEINGSFDVFGAEFFQAETDYVDLFANQGLELFSHRSMDIAACEELVLYGIELVEIEGEQIDIIGDETRVVSPLSVGGGDRIGNEMLFVGRDERFRPLAEDPRIVVQDESAEVKLREMFSLINNGGSLFSFTDTNLGSSWFFSSNSIGDFNISRSGTGGSELSIKSDGRIILGPGGTRNFDLRPNGNLHILGTLFQSSDRNLKEEFKDVKPASVLSKIDQLPVTTWQFKANQAGNRHMGPTAQDFYSAFGLGQDDKTIAPVDGVGVSLAGIKALSSQVKQKDAEIKELAKELKSQKDLIQQQQQMLSELSSRLSALESESQDKSVAMVNASVSSK